MRGSGAEGLARQTVLREFNTLKSRGVILKLTGCTASREVMCFQHRPGMLGVRARQGLVAQQIAAVGVAERQRFAAPKTD